jgi:hypothetical protein
LKSIRSPSKQQQKRKLELVNDLRTDPYKEKSNMQITRPLINLLKTKNGTVFEK